MDYRKLAEEFGGRAESQPQEAPPIDYRALAEQLGGVAEEAQPLAQPLAQPPAQPEKPAEPPSFFDRFLEAAKPEPFTRQVLDVPIGVTKGGVTGFRILADAFGAGSGVSEAIKSSEKYLEGLMSAQARNDAEEVSRIMQEAEDKGFGDQVRAAVKAFSVAPIDLISQALGTAAPVILGGLATSVLGGGALATAAVTTGLAGATGAGLIKGNIYDAVKEEMLKAGDPPALAEEKAQQAQAYGGKNLDMILAGTALGAFAGRTGVEKLILNKIAAKKAAEQGLLRRVGEGTVTEAFPEFLQAGQEALATNIALQREGFDVPTMRGVVGQATLEALAGGALGATTGAVIRPRTLDTPEDRAISALDKLAADEEAEAATSGLISEEDLFAEEAAAAAPAEDLIPATLEELKKIDKDLRKKLGRTPTTDEVERALNEFEREKTQRFRAESGGREPTVPLSGAEEAGRGVAGAPARVEPTGLGPTVGIADVAGARKEPTLAALKPEDTIVYKDVASPTGITQAGNVTLQNYFKTYYGLPAESLPKAAAKVMPLLQKAENLLQRFGAVYSESNQPFVGVDPSQKYKHRAARSPEYSEAYKHHPGGILRKLASSAMAVDKDYKTANPEQLAKDVANFEERLNKFEEAIAKLPPPLTNEERQAREAAFEAKQAPAIATVPKKQQLEAFVSLLRKEPQRLAKAPIKSPTYTPARSDPARLQEAIDAGLITQEELDRLQKQSDDFFAEEPTAPTEEVAGPSVSAMQAEIDALRAAGAEVPTFEAPSTAAAKREAKAKKERSKAIAKLAAELGGTPTDEDGGFRPARDEEEVETIKAKAGVNARRLSKLLGPKLYGEPSEMPFVSVKEMVQNAFDAIKPMQERGQLQKGKIAIGVDQTSRIISVNDNGTGMSPETLSTTFLTIAGTKKEGERDSGGLGIAKMQFLFNNEGIRVVTMRDGVASELISSGPQLEEAMDNPDINPDIRVYRGDSIPAYVKSMLPEGHGTYVEVVVPESYNDPSTGEDKPIPIEDYYSDYTVLKYSPLFGNIDVEFNGRRLDIGSKFPYEDYTTFANVKFDWGVARIYVQKEPERFMWSGNTSILSNGLWQFNLTLKSGDEVIPRRIYVDVSPKKSVKPEDPGYPFDLNRQRFSPSVEKSFEQIFKYLRLVYRAADFASSADNFGSIQYLDLVGRNDEVQASPLQKLAPTPTSEIFTATDISEGDQVEVKDGVLYVKGKAVRELTDADMKAATIDFNELKIDESLISKDRVMLHINAGVAEVNQEKVRKVQEKITDLTDEMYDKHGTTLPEKIEDPAARAEYKEKLRKLKEERNQAERGEVTSVADIGRQKFGAKFDEFLFDIGNAFLDLRNFAATLDPSFANFTDEAVGVSLDNGYRGVSIKLPFSGVFINPFAPQYTNLSAAASGTWGTMVHELAHVNVRDHGASFTSEMQKITLLLEASVIDGNNTWPQIRNNILRAFRDYKDVFEYFNKELTNGKLKPLGKRLSDSSEEQIGDAGGAERVAGFRGAAEGGPDIPGRSDLSSGNIGEERERARDAGEATTSDYEQRIIELGLKAGDINPAMVSAIANNDLNGALRIAVQKLSGFSADLAKALLELKLPTNISFNTGRELVRRSIDDWTAPQQERLFRYVQMHYPEVYEKYFKNYDRSESLESVAEGLIELQKPNYNLGPVIAEFGDVAGAYKKFIEGLVTPGAYYPRFDEISLNTDTLTGKSYRVFLHEVVHAATEYVLNTYGTNPASLTPGQRAAAKELTTMYDYAVKQLGDTVYGTTNIYEFVAEVFTNGRFQNLLKGIKYEPKKAPFLTRFVRAILKAFGLDNLAGNAMAEATKIFSAVRTTTPLSIGPRFAKTGPKQPRIRGPISQNWRTAESQTTSLIKVFNDALKGRMSWDEALKIIGPSMWNDTTGRFRRGVLGVLNLRQIDDLTKTKFPQISGAIRIIEQMLAYRGSIMKSAEDIVKDWTKAQAKKPKQGQLLSRLMIETTLRGIDPDKPGTKAMNAALVQAWNQLDPEFKQIYRQVRDFYASSVNNMVREMKSRIAKSDKPLSEKKAAIREINSKFGPDKLVQPYFPLRRFGKFWFQVGSGNFKEFYEFESEQDREVAMRIRENELRNGNAQQRALADTIRKGNGLSELFTQNLTTTQVLKEAEDIIDNVTATTVGDAKQEMKDSLNQLIYILLPQQSMRKMFINRKGVQGASADMIRVFATSAVHSAYQQSRFKFADKFINNLNNAREYVDPKNGFTKDRAAVYQDYIQEVERRVPYILSNEDTSLGAVVAGKASELTFFYMLSAPFSAMLNVLGVAQITMPYIGARYGYAKTNALMIKNMMRYLGTMPRRSLLPLAQGKFMDVSFPSIVEGAKLPPLLNRAAFRFMEGQINISLTNDLMDMGGRPSALYTGRYNMVKKMLSGLFHQSERLGREVTLLTAFELAYDKLSKSPKKDLRGVIERDAQGNPIMNTPEEAFELAIAEAIDLVGLSLGDFTRQMKPRYFVSPLMSVITKFKQYSVLATYAVIRNFYFLIAAPFRKKEIEEFRQLMLKDKISPPVIEQRIAEAEAQRKELYREGRRRLAGILAVTYLLGGNEASPFYSIGIGPLVKMLANEDDDEFFDWENWLKNYMEEELGGAAGDLFAEMGMNPDTAYEAGRFVGGALQRGVVTELTGGELAGRVSLDPMSLWYREGRYSPDTRESLLEEITANAGPVVGLAVNWVESYKLFQEGQYQRAFEKAAPALISKPVAAARIAEEDARTASGIKLADNFSAWELAMLSIGLQPTRLAQAQKSAIEAKTYTEKIKDRRATLMDRLWMERDSEDGYNETLERINEFNVKYPNYAITPKNLQESFERRAKNQSDAETIGGQFDKKSMYEAMQMMRYGRE